MLFLIKINTIRRELIQIFIKKLKLMLLVKGYLFLDLPCVNHRGVIGMELGLVRSNAGRKRSPCSNPWLPTAYL